MRILFVFLFILFVDLSAQAQDLKEKIASETCQCLDESPDQLSLEEALKKCLPEAMAKMYKEANPEELEVLGHVGGIQNTFKAVRELLPGHCQKIRAAELEQKREKFYGLSGSGKANKFFAEGNELLEREAYPEAAKKFRKALKADDQFVYALDHLAIAYRQLGKWDKAIEYYTRSLEIFPEGDLALLNIAVAFSLKEDFQQSLKYYEELNFLYPDNPEGYFGIARISFILEDYERALENVFASHIMYVKEGSGYVGDSEQLINMMYHKLHELNRKDLFLSKAEEFGINVDMEN